MLASFIVSWFYVRQIVKRPYEGYSTGLVGFSHTQHLTDFYGDVYGSIEVSIDVELLAKQPEWDNFSQNPPLSARSALRIADEFRRYRLRDYTNFQWYLNSIRLTPLDREMRKWIWIVQFELVPNSDLTMKYFPNLDLYISMDGSLIEPDDPDDLVLDFDRSQNKR